MENLDPMISSTTETIMVLEQSQVAEARRRVNGIAKELGFDETEQGKASIMATELATNLLKHTSGGELLATTTMRGTQASLTLETLDRGPGMANVAECMRDGFSTAGSSGSGLGALSRLSSGSLEIYSAPGEGSVIAATLAKGEAAPRHARSHLDMFGIGVPHPGENVSGDGWSARVGADRSMVMIVDGLGHGLLAAQAAELARRAFAEETASGFGMITPGQMIDALHQALRSTRGAVAAVALIDTVAHTVTYAGIGNIGAVIVNGEQSKRLVSHNGTLGVQVRRVQEFLYPFPAGSTLVLHSDGIATHWDLPKHPALARQSAMMIAGALYRDARRVRDDATVVVVKESI